MIDKYKLISDAVYRQIDQTALHLDMYLPLGYENKKSPCAVFFHGGAWLDGQKTDVREYPIIMERLLEAGFVVASVEYRLVRKNGGGFPQSVEDVIAALKYLDTQTDARIDERRKAVFGISAGGYLALMAALYQDVYGNRSPIKAIVDMCGTAYMRGESYNIDNPPQTKIFIKDFIGAYRGEDCNPLSLMNLVSDKPSLYIVHGEYDDCVSVENSRILFKKACDCGFNAEYTEVRNSLHTFGSYNGERIKPSMTEISNMIAEFIIRECKGE